MSTVLGPGTNMVQLKMMGVTNGDRVWLFERGKVGKVTFIAYIDPHTVRVNDDNVVRDVHLDQLRRHLHGVLGIWVDFDTTERELTSVR